MKIDRVKIKNFKSLKSLDQALSNLNLITGVNSSGKSSFIQALLLLKQNEDRFYSLRGSKMAMIKGLYVDLGNKKDILFEEAFKENIEVSIFSESIEHTLSFNTENLQIEMTELLPEERQDNFNIFFDDFQYIQTDRITPRITYDLSDEEIAKGLIGSKGEYTAHYLAQNRHQIIIEALRHPKSQTNRLLENVSLWMNEISSNIEVKATIYDDIQQVNLTYSYTYDHNVTQEYAPLNVGFGITYILPIVVAILKAKEGDLIIIENPESHLHPKAQSKIAELCAIASSIGVQIIIETHSDHIFNGIRIAIKNKILKPELSKIYYFRKEFNKLETKIDEIKIDEQGSIDQYPIGFFDQFDNDLDKLVVW